MSEVKAHAQDYTVAQWQIEIWSLGILAPKPTFLKPMAHCLPAVESLVQVLCFASPAFKCIEELFSQKQEWSWSGEERCSHSFFPHWSSCSQRLIEIFRGTHLKIICLHFSVLHFILR